jgi:hypothetical protein
MTASGVRGLVPYVHASIEGARIHRRLHGRLGQTCSYGPSSGLGSRSVVVCAAAADLRQRTWIGLYGVHVLVVSRPDTIRCQVDLLGHPLICVCCVELSRASGLCA